MLNSQQTCITGVATAVPQFEIKQNDVAKLIAGLFSGADISDTVLRVFTNDHIQTRRFVRPLEWYSKPKGFGESNAVFVSSAVELCVEAATKALRAARLAPEEISAIVIATTTGLATPSLDAIVAQKLGLPAHVTRLPIVGLGCAAGVSGLARAAELCSVRNGKPVVFIAVEICSVTFQHTDTSKSNIVGASLFGDGAAAVVLQGAHNGVAIRNFSSHQYPNSFDVMGWDVVDSGLRVRFARSIPDLVQSSARSIVDTFLSTIHTTISEVDNIVVHPGGLKVLNSYSTAFSRTPQDFSAASDILRSFGNMSSPTVLFVLERMWSNVSKGNSTTTLMLALGPGFSAECMYLQTL